MNITTNPRLSWNVPSDTTPPVTTSGSVKSGAAVPRSSMVEGVADITECYHRRSNSMRPLDGITVITLEHAISAPLATRHLADLGARVIKIERPGTGDFA